MKLKMFLHWLFTGEGTYIVFGHCMIGLRDKQYRDVHPDWHTPGPFPLITRYKLTDKEYREVHKRRVAPSQ